mmetsp:Transcript_30221/g.59041  ORF Transcript_30221/g.59041 Transcript_30221/m.59041 type:complete len:357 (+) Transcript_30221:137-1207(+)
MGSIIQLIGQPRDLSHSVKRCSQKPDFFSDALDWKIYRAAKVPGPGEYEVGNKYENMPGGRWSKSQGRKTFESTGGDTPGPGQYDVATVLKHLDPPASFNMGRPKTTSPGKSSKGSGTPGPASYTLPDMNQPSGGRFNMSKPKSDVEWKIIQASKVPAPGQYGAGLVSTLTGGKFNTSKITTDIDWIVMRAAKTPGPGQYDLNGNTDVSTRIPGGKFNTGKSKSGLDWAIARGKMLPGPGNYDIVRCDKYLEKNKGFSFASRPGPCHLPAPYTELSYVSTSARPPRTAKSEVASPESSVLLEKSTLSRSSVIDKGALERAREKTEKGLIRMKHGHQLAAVKRRQRSTLGFGRSFFM